MKGRRSQIGDTRTAPNGYHYTKTEDGWILTHRLVLEKKLGRKIADDERVRFLDGDRNNYADPDNLEVYKVKEKSKAQRKALLEAKLEAIQAELEELEMS